MTRSWGELIAEAKDRNNRALGQLITRVENREFGWKDAMKEVYAGAGRAKVIGITGSPGAGKSTLTSALTKCLSDKGKSVGVIAVDPSSPFSGGAILGDRIRMTDLESRSGVYIRSMATRGALGGLCQSARDVTRILDLAGKDIVIIETVGVGQDEIDVVRTADIVIVVCVPGLGDGIQAIKAGILEIADVYVVNKSDREGADEVVADLKSMLELSNYEDENVPPVVKTSAIDNKGIERLIEVLTEMLEKPLAKRMNGSKRVKEEVLALVEGEIVSMVSRACNDGLLTDEIVNELIARRTDPYSVADCMVSSMKSVVKQGTDKEW